VCEWIVHYCSLSNDRSLVLSPDRSSPHSWKRMSFMYESKCWRLVTSISSVVLTREHQPISTNLQNQKSRIARMKLWLQRRPARRIIYSTDVSMAGNFSGWSRLQHGWSVKYTVKAQKDKSEDTYTFGRRSQHAAEIRGGGTLLHLCRRSSPPSTFL